MMRSPSATWSLGALVAVAVLGAAARCSRGSAPSGTASRGRSEARETLAVGFLPVTCHLTCPVTDYATKTSRSTRFESQRFTDFPTVVETVKSGRLDATFMIAPLAMKLREQGVPVQIAYLGHRDGSTVIVRKDLPAKSLKDLTGKTFAIPSKYSNQNLVIRKLMKDEGVDPATIRFVELPPPDMPGALASKAIDAYFVGEPHAARAELDGSGPRALPRQGHLAALHLVRAGGDREADRRAPGGRPRPGARHRRERRVGRDASGRGREGRLAVLPPGRDAGALRADAAARSRQLPDADARATTRCSGSPTWRSRPASSSGAST